MMKSFLFALTIGIISLTSCNNNSTNQPKWESEITMDEDLNITDMGHSGELTPDGEYYYDGTVTLYSADGDSETFECYEGTNGLEKGCRGVIVDGIFYNLDRNKWVTINGIKYKGFKNSSSL
ncbi:MAG: hypothetical protein KBT27_10335 [Prevotellaceae bacterium]|nr:hypothetical protein [Candidatus Faecinaster equi]